MLTSRDPFEDTTLFSTPSGPIPLPFLPVTLGELLLPLILQGLSQGLLRGTKLQQRAFPCARLSLSGESCPDVSVKDSLRGDRPWVRGGGVLPGTICGEHRNYKQEH